MSVENILKVKTNPGKETRESHNIIHILEADTLTVPCRNFVLPQWNMIGVLDVHYPGEFRALSVETLFKALEIPESKLHEVYEYDEVQAQKAGDPRKGYVGRFTESGKQKLADLLGKTIEFYHQPGSEPVLDATSRDVYYPQLGKFTPADVWMG